jgi:tetratricopeptide (TPR) repeat protein
MLHRQKNLLKPGHTLEGLAYALKNIGLFYFIKADYIQTLTYWNESLKQFENVHDKKGIANILSNLGGVYAYEGDDAKALDYYLKALKYAEEINDTLRLVTVLNNIGASYFNKGATRSKALSYYLRALPLFEAIKSDDIGTLLVNIGEIYLEKDEDSLALEYFERSAKAYHNSKDLPYSLIALQRFTKREEIILRHLNITNRHLIWQRNYLPGLKCHNLSRELQG